MYAERLNFLPRSGSFGVIKKAMGGSSRGRRSALFILRHQIIVPNFFERPLPLVSISLTPRQLFAGFLQSRIDKGHTLC